RPLTLTLLLCPLTFAAVAEPEISLALNGGTNPTVYPGWPIIAGATLIHPAFGGLRTAAAPIDIVTPGSWTAAISLAVRSEDTGKIVVWPFAIAGPGDGSTLTLDHETRGRL